jgi:hypothetical protein
MGICAIFTGNKLFRIESFDIFAIHFCLIFIQALPIALGVPLAGYLNLNYPGQVGYYMCSGCSIVGSLTLFLVDVHKRNVRLHKEKSTK